MSFMGKRLNVLANKKKIIVAMEGAEAYSGTPVYCC